MKILETERLILRHLEMTDLDDLFSLYSDPVIRRYFPEGTLNIEETKEELEWFLDGHPHHPELGLWATIYKPSMQFIGRCGLLPWVIDGQHEVEVAYMIAREYWGQGLGTEAARGILNYGFNQLGLSRLICIIDRDNQASIKVASKIGMTFEREALDDKGPFMLYSVAKSQGKIMKKTNENPKKPVAQDAYDELAEPYAERVDTKAHNAYYERPATLSLLPPLKGKRVLDAACGPGAYADRLLSMGAEVVAFDGNAKMVALAKKRLGDKVQVFMANLEGPLDFLEPESFDAIVCPLAMDYVREWEPTFREFRRVLKTGGCLVFSMEHPYSKYEDHRLESSYFDVDLVEFTWRGFGKPVSVPSFRRPFSEVINPLIRAEFTLDYVLEPIPTPEFKIEEPEDYEERLRSPVFLCIRAIKR